MIKRIKYKNFLFLIVASLALILNANMAHGYPIKTMRLGVKS